MTSDPGKARDPRDVDAEFARMLEGEGLALRPGDAPREPAAADHPAREEDSSADSREDDSLWSFSADSPAEPPSPESIARSRAQHPAAGLSDPTAGLRGAVGPRELDDDEVIYGDFEPPDPDLPTPSEATLWSWTALLGGFVLMLVATVTPSLPSFLGWIGGLAALGGLVSLLLRAPRNHDDDSHDGAEL
ncbi:hypothetical protein GCM10023160_25120 [Brachybacterium paraconglomeratum]|uniref:hypothetical protein n=1 Tax=Brachybacterium paraconglomeratum TaxID=173362 RepID=UPI0031F14500